MKREDLKRTTYNVDEIRELISFAKIDAPTLHRVMIAPIAPRKQSAGGIIIPESSRDAQSITQQFGIIAAIGKTAFIRSDTGECMFEPKPKVGDVVMYGRFTGAGRSEIYEVEVEDENGDWSLEDLKVVMVSDTEIISQVSDLTGRRLA